MSLSSPGLRVLAMKPRTGCAPLRRSPLLRIAIVVLLAAPAATRAQAFGIGLSSIRSQAYGNAATFGFAPLEGDRFSFALAAGDFDGDGADDIASGIPLDNGVQGFEIQDCGAVLVRYGQVGVGLGTEIVHLSQFPIGSPDAPEIDDRFGRALAAGDFDADGKVDLAIGVPGNGSGAYAFSNGAVAIHYGASGGLPDAPAEYLQRGMDGLPPDGSDAFANRFGEALASGDFNGDGKLDLAVGSPGDNVATPAVTTNAGTVTVLYGDAGGQGLLPFDGLLLSQESAGIVGGAESEDLFGATVVSGDFDGNGYDDLAIGAPGRGIVSVLHGGPGGLVPYSGYDIYQGHLGIPDIPESGDEFGAALTTGDWNGDGTGDLAIGVPGEDDVGAVLVLFGSPFGLIFNNHVWWGQGDTGGVGESGDRFAQSLASGDFDGDGYDDLVVGAPLEDLVDGGAIVDAGECTLLYGSGAGAPNWFNVARTSHFQQGSFFLGGGYDEPGDHFGWALAAGDFDHDGHDDLAVGHPEEDLGGIDEGAVTVLMGAAGTGVWNGADIFASGTAQVPGGVQASQDLGRSLATGDFDGDGHADLAIGVPYRHINGAGDDVGRESVLYGALFSDGFYYGFPYYWSAFAP